MIRASVLGAALLAATVGLAGAQGFGTSQGNAHGGPQAAAPGYSLMALQRALQQAGYDPGPVDGAMGARTRAAIRAYQQDSGLPVTGEPSPGLYARLSGAATAGSADAYGRAPSGAYGQGGTYDQAPPAVRGQLPPAGAMAADPDLIADVQLALRREGYGIATVSGTLDAETRAAIRAYQRDSGLPVTGEPDRRLLAALRDGGGMGAGTGAGAGSTGGRAAVEPRDAGMSGVDVAREVEARLQNKGFTVGPVDGEIDPQSAEAIRRYQSLRGFEPTGMASRQLLEDLRASNVTAQQAQPRSGEGLADSLLRGLGRQLGQPQQ
ncbi:peptidoglycan-binding domain-containing protein [Azospirillum halopraeferens]|uniref:peptidoglycan-binding domain-containing protein n=1 Tax=Azospirillum halopraeferens TaxID=34010 RepID=UPI00041819D7|nr:peptidoglycan-binding domain-containing protein [Azospirillum halopraeferens]